MASERDMPRFAAEHQAPAATTYPTYPAHPAYPAGPSARTARPPLTKRLRPGHWAAIDWSAAVFAGLCDLAVLRSGFDLTGRTWFPAALLLAVAVAAPVALRRRAPMAALGWLLILAALLSRLPLGVAAALFLAAAYVLYTVTVASSRRNGAAALGLTLGTMLVVAATSGQGGLGALRGALVPVALASIIAWMTGYSVRQRRLYVVRLQHQAVSSAVAEERLRIARELHDVVAHSMSVIAVQAGYGQYVIDTSPDGARDALGAIQATSRDALEEMRRMLGVLRQQDSQPAPAPPGGLFGAGQAPPATAGLWPSSAVPAPGPGPYRGGQAPLAPAPGLADLDRLIKRTGGAGVRVSLEVRGRAGPVPAGIDLSAYRIIQEALTNVVKHAGGGAHCTVSLGYGTNALDVHVIDDGGSGPASSVPGPREAPVPSGSGSHGSGRPAIGIPLAGAGHGIIGMRERVNLCGGTFFAGPLTGGGFAVAVTLPLPWPAKGDDASSDDTRRDDTRPDLAGRDGDRGDVDRGDLAGASLAAGAFDRPAAGRGGLG